MLDFIIKDGIYPDFDAGKMRRGDIGIYQGKIVSIGLQEEAARQTIDAREDVVAPGFIDIHMHEENFKNEGTGYVIGQMMLEMGVTTAVGGNCGIQNQSLSSFKEVLLQNGGAPVNYIMLTGYNTFRRQVGVGRYERASEAAQQQIRKMLQKDLDEGAFGISFGIEYDPGITKEEILYALDVSQDPGLLAAAHYRADCLTDIASIEEMIEIASKIPMKFQISHLSSCSAMGLMKESLVAIHRAIEKNPRLDFDTYPYNAFSTHMGSAVFEDGCLEKWHKDYRDILLTDAPYKDVRCTKEIFDKVRVDYPDMLAVAFVMNENEISAAIAAPDGMIASDAIIQNGSGHPRAAGTFPRVLGKYVREEQALPLIEALRKMTLAPAERLGLSQKGRIAIGCDADLTIFNPDTIIDGATFSELHRQPEGIDYVFIGGEIALHKKATINGRLGRFLSYNQIERI